MGDDLFRIYRLEECGDDGYPFLWHETVKHLVREEADHRCVRCGHPYLKGSGEWSQCDISCIHEGPLWVRAPDGVPSTAIGIAGELVAQGFHVQAEWRILTVHHLNGIKADLRWWNLVSLCQRCHLRIQRTVVMPRVFPFEHSEWFKPYAAGWYAHAYLGESIDREETMTRLDELLALELMA